MTKSLICKDTKDLFNDLNVLRFKSILRIARRKSEILKAAVTSHNLGIHPGNQLEQLEGERKGQFSIQINEGWRRFFIREILFEEFMKPLTHL